MSIFNVNRQEENLLGSDAVHTPGCVVFWRKPWAPGARERGQTRAARSEGEGSPAAAGRGFGRKGRGPPCCAVWATAGPAPKWEPGTRRGQLGRVGGPCQAPQKDELRGPSGGAGSPTRQAPRQAVVRAHALTGRGLSIMPTGARARRLPWMT